MRRYKTFGQTAPPQQQQQPQFTSVDSLYLQDEPNPSFVGNQRAIRNLYRPPVNQDYPSSQQTQMYPSSFPQSLQSSQQSSQYPPQFQQPSQYPPQFQQPSQYPPQFQHPQLVYPTVSEDDFCDMIAKHLKKCTSCSKQYKGDHMYIIIIVVLILFIMFLLTKLVDKS
jgi:hypothetical protein